MAHTGVNTAINCHLFEQGPRGQYQIRMTAVWDGSFPVEDEALFHDRDSHSLVSRVRLEDVFNFLQPSLWGFKKRLEGRNHHIPV